MKCVCELQGKNIGNNFPSTNRNLMRIGLYFVVLSCLAKLCFVVKLYHNFCAVRRWYVAFLRNYDCYFFMFCCSVWSVFCSNVMFCSVLSFELYFVPVLE